MSKLSNPLRGPADDVLAFREMEDRRYVGQGDAGGGGHRVRGDARVGGFEGPGRMVNLQAVGAAAVIDRIEAVALRQEMLQRARYGRAGALDAGG